MEYIEFENDKYPHFQSLGNASQFAIPFAKFFCKGIGYDIGYNKDEWKYPNAIGIDINNLNDDYHANNLPDGFVDYIYSSHCLEHLNDWVGALDHWTTRLHKGGIVFLYLPHPDQGYWKPWNNRKHIHLLEPNHIKDYFTAKNFSKVFVTKGYDLNHSYYAVAEL